MATITVSLPSDGDTIDAVDYNTPINIIVSEINGGIDADNLKANAVTTAKIADANVTMSKISNPYIFRAFQNSNQTYSDGDTIKLDTESYDDNSNFNTNTYKYVAPITGMYHFDFSAYSTVATGLVIGLYIGNTLSIRGGWPQVAGSFIVSNGSGDVKLTANDEVTLRMATATGTKTITAGTANTYLNGHLVSI